MISSLCMKKNSLTNKFMGTSLFIYNLLSSLASWYSIFKICQYYKNDNINYNNKIITCYINSVNDIEDLLLGYTVNGTILIILIHIFVSMCSCCHQCCNDPPLDDIGCCESCFSCLMKRLDCIGVFSSYVYIYIYMLYCFYYVFI